MKLLDLFCGAGGAAMGYARAGFEVVGVDYRPQKNYPFEFIQADAMEFPLEGYGVIHASPPCQAYIQRNKRLNTKHPKLVEATRARLKAWGGVYVIENVIPEILEAPFVLCGTLFGLKVLRHRYFETNVGMVLTNPCWHNGTVAGGDYAAVYAFGGKGHRHGPGVRDPRSTDGPAWAEAMGIDWMTGAELTQAIPPAYCEFIGKALLDVLRGGERRYGDSEPGRIFGTSTSPDPESQRPHTNVPAGSAFSARSGPVASRGSDESSPQLSMNLGGQD